MRGQRALAPGIGLLCIAVLAGTAFGDPAKQEKPAPGRIVVGEPTLKPLDYPGAETQGRLSGDVTKSPGCTVAVLDAKGQPIQSVSLKSATAFYELKWFDPGTYSVRVEVRGYPTVVLANVPIQARHETVLNIHTEGKPSPTASARPSKPGATQPSAPRRLPDWKPAPKGNTNVPKRNFKPKGFKSLQKGQKPGGKGNKGKKKHKGKKKKR